MSETLDDKMRPAVGGRTPTGHRTAAWTLVCAVAWLALARGLPAETFFVGDMGVKLLAARNAIEHPAAPLEIVAPDIGGEPMPQLMDPFFVPHGDHAHAVTPALFPLLTAPAIAALGPRGAYVLPGLSFVLLLPLTIMLGRRLRLPISESRAFLLIAGCSPLLFYSLEFWEHVPAVCLVTAATVLVLRPDDARPTGGRDPAPDSAAWPLIGAGLALSLAAQLRPETLCYAAALAAAVTLCPGIALRWPGDRSRWRPAATAALGFAIGSAPMIVYDLVHFGSVVGLHVGSNYSAFVAGWPARRLEILDLWFLPSGSTVAVAGVVLLAAGIGAGFAGGASLAVLCGFRRRVGVEATGPGATTRPGPLDGRVGTTLATAGVALVSLAAARGHLARESLLAVFPAALLALVPGRWAAPASGTRSAERFLAVVATSFAAFVLLAAPNDGGGQWGPRYLLPICVPVALLVSAKLVGFLGRTGPTRRSASGWILVSTVVLGVAGNVWVQRRSYESLRSAKILYGDLVEELRTGSEGTEYLVTDVWWLDQVAASLSGERQFLFTRDAETAVAVVGRVAAAGVEAVTVASMAGSGDEAFANWMPPGCSLQRLIPLRQRDLVIGRVGCERPDASPEGRPRLAGRDAAPTRAGRRDIKPSAPTRRSRGPAASGSSG